MKIGIILLAAGAGKRFGGNKLMADVGGKPLYLNAMEKTDRLEKAAFKVVVTGSPVIAEAGRRPGISGGGELSAGDGNFPVGCSWHRGRPKSGAGRSAVYGLRPAVASGSYPEIHAGRL